MTQQDIEHNMRNDIEQKAQYDWMEEARQIAAQCWCDKETEHLVMIPELAEAIAKRVSAWMMTGAQHCRNEEFWRGQCESQRQTIEDRNNEVENYRNLLTEAYKAARKKDAEIERLQRAQRVLTDEELRRYYDVLLPEKNAQIDQLQSRVKDMEREIAILRQYGNKDCAAMADEVINHPGETK